MITSTAFLEVVVGALLAFVVATNFVVVGFGDGFGVVVFTVMNTVFLGTTFLVVVVVEAFVKGCFFTGVAMFLVVGWVSESYRRILNNLLN